MLAGYATTVLKPARGRKGDGGSTGGGICVSKRTLPTMAARFHEWDSFFTAWFMVMVGSGEDSKNARV